MTRQEKVRDFASMRPGYYEPFTEEAKLLKESKMLAEMLGALVVREESTVRGRSDLLLCYQGQFIACELKDDEGTPSKHQLKFVDAVQKAGGKAAICRTTKEVLDLILSGNQEKVF